MQRATVITASPLTVQLRAAATDVPATQLQGTSYTPAPNDDVLVAVLDDGHVVVIGMHA